MTTDDIERALAQPRIEPINLGHITINRDDLDRADLQHQLDPTPQISLALQLARAYERALALRFALELPEPTPPAAITRPTPVQPHRHTLGSITHRDITRIISQIDTVLDDWEHGEDAMRWTPEPGQPEPPVLAWLDIHMPELQLDTWQRGFVRRWFTYGAVTRPTDRFTITNAGP